jgi:hypothetical protein
MHLAIDQLKTQPELLLIDGNRFNAYKSTPHQCIIKGDAHYLSMFVNIPCASGEKTIDPIPNSPRVSKSPSVSTHRFSME